LATKNIKTATQVITEFLAFQAKDESLNVDTVAAVTTLRRDDDLSKIKLLRKLEEERKTAFKGDAREAGDD
jgi:hypothetical protein